MLAFAYWYKRRNTAAADVCQLLPNISNASFESFFPLLASLAVQKYNFRWTVMWLNFKVSIEIFGNVWFPSLTTIFISFRFRCHSWYRFHNAMILHWGSLSLHPNAELLCITKFHSTVLLRAFFVIYLSVSLVCTVKSFLKRSKKIVSLKKFSLLLGFSIIWVASFEVCD